MHATAGRRRRRAEIELAVGRRVEPPCWTDEELPEVGDPAVDVAADVVGVMALDVGRTHDVTRQDARSESWGESFDLRLDPLAHVDGRSIRDMAVGPADMLAGREPTASVPPRARSTAASASATRCDPPCANGQP